MTIYAVDNLPAPSDIELEVLDRRWEGDELMTLPDFCDICLHIHDRPRREFVGFINAKCDRIEARGEAIKYPLRMTRWAWYVEWNAFDAHDERDTLMGARYAGCR